MAAPNRPASRRSSLIWNISANRRWRRSGQAILSGVPGLTERIKWNAPSFGPGDDDRITMRLQPGDRLQLVLHRGAKARPVDGFTFSDPAALIAWAAADRGVVTIAPGELDQLRAALVDLLRRWVAATT